MSIRPAKLSDAIADHIQQLILEGALQPGERLLSERDLSLKLEVSRPSLREALAKLMQLGLLRTDGQGSSYVSEEIGKSIRDPLLLIMDTPEGPFDYLEFRSIVEAAATALAAERASDLDRQAIDSHYRRMEKAQQSGSATEQAEADADFHLAIYEASHNLFLLFIMRNLETMLRSDVMFNRRAIHEKMGATQTLLDEHKEIYEAVMAGLPEKASEAAQAHMSTLLATMHEIREAERRLQVSIRRLERADLVAPPKKSSLRKR